VAGSKCSQGETGLDHAIERRADSVEITSDPPTKRNLGKELDSSSARAIHRVTPEGVRAIRDCFNIE
jgi:hypothetical protein